ncbi:MAG: hypothetical protein K9J37_01980 [Saprospiraceae bacterium]|nr:hypothetical protein [Saprospiraceae bacterium]MCF8248647.1 hypothetical protein [Saprospiraceae bacterium]MCF8278863.1 hypothetical protein [Bacteroidales bacterium]MCF8310663.1 hypothetical protein [Saprospiraceae bacterium]MCF8439222.1 hypothetical protein [Saprospiraceae bacterium]
MSIIPIRYQNSIEVTIEEKILKMQERKAQLAGEILATGDGVAFSRDELAELLD